MARCVIAGVIVAYLLAVVQTTLGGPISVYGVAPDLLFLWTVCIGLLGGANVGALNGFGSGLLQGALAQAGIGGLAFGKAISGFAAGLLATKMFKENWLVPAVCAALLTVVNEAGFLAFSRGGSWAQAGRVIGVRVVYHAALAPIAFALVVRGRRLLRGRREEMA